MQSTENTTPVENPSSTTESMRAARMHQVGMPLTIDRVRRPGVGPRDVLVEVKACGVVPNLVNVLSRLQERSPYLALPELPAIFGLDAAGVVVEKGPQCHGVVLGQRVYVNPARYCGNCRSCRMGDTTSCDYFTFGGYFGFSPKSQTMFRDYPYGGLAEYMTAPADSLVNLPDCVSFETAARWGYLGTGYGALRRAGASASTTLLINGVTGTLGVGVALLALAMGVRRIFGTGRKKHLLERVRNLNPERIAVHSLDDQPLDEWVRSVNDGDGVDIVVDATAHGAPHSIMQQGVEALRRGGRLVNISGMKGGVPFEVHKMMARNQAIIGSLWFTTAHGQEMADLAEAGLLDLNVLQHNVFPLEDVNTALSSLEARDGGFENFVVKP